MIPNLIMFRLTLQHIDQVQHLYYLDFRKYLVYGKAKTNPTHFVTTPYFDEYTFIIIHFMAINYTTIINKEVALVNN